MADQRNKVGRSEQVNDSTQEGSRIMYPGVVRVAEDPTGLNRVKVSIKDLKEDKLDAEDLPWCYPKMTKNFNIPIEVGDAVLVEFADPEYPYLERYWTTKYIGDFRLQSEPQYEEALRGLHHSRSSPPRKPSPTYPTNYKDFWIVGKQNSDIIFSEGGVEMVGGLRRGNNPDIFNTNNPSRIKAYQKGEVSQAAILADKVMLLSNRNRPKPDPSLDPDRLEALFEQLSPLPKGDVLVTILRIMREAILGHTHEYHREPANDSDAVIERLVEADLNSINSETHKIN